MSAIRKTLGQAHADRGIIVPSVDTGPKLSVASAEIVARYGVTNDNGSVIIAAARTKPKDTPLPVIDPRDWQGKPVPERQWFVEGIIPDRTVTNLSGAGGSGKTEIILQLVAASSLKTQWFGKDVSVGPCLYYGAEDEADELHRRLETIVQRAGRNLSDLDGIRLIPMAGFDAVLAEPDRLRNLVQTAIFPKLEAQARLLRPKLIVIDPSADVFGGDEINRAQVRKFVSMLRTLALDIDCAVLLLSHPSLSGLNSGTGMSGSTAWHNSVRSRLYLEVPNESPDERVLKVVKANYGKTGAKIEMRWNDGVYDLDTGPDPVIDKMLNKSVDDVFMAVFRKLTGQGQALGPNVGPTYAPKKIASHSDAKGHDKKKLAVAMQRLLDGGRLRIDHGATVKALYAVGGSLELTLRIGVRTDLRIPSNPFEPPVHTHPLYSCAIRRSHFGSNRSNLRIAFERLKSSGVARLVALWPVSRFN